MPHRYTGLRQRLARFRQLRPPGRRPLLEAIFYLLAAQLVLRLIPFRWLTPYFTRPALRPEASYARRMQLGKLVASPCDAPHEHEISGGERLRLREAMPQLISEAAWFLPGETACFARAITAQALLRRLGVATTLFYGAAMLPDAGLTAHVWLQDGDAGVIGHDTPERYHVLARYPDKIPPSR